MPPKKPGKSSKAYKKAAILPEGEVVTDFDKRVWKLGKSFASGGFGRIYFAQPVGGPKERVVLKMEPADNGPLFQEIHVYQRIAKPEMLQAWKKNKHLSFLGIPPFLGSGKHEKDGVELRFLLMPEYGKDLEHFRSSTPCLDPKKVVIPLGVTCLTSLEYLHSVSYVHADLKAENLLLSTPSSKDLSKSVLVDFGLAKKVPDHPVYKEQPKKANDGTLIFTSLDAHKGCHPSYRGDVEILGYNLLYWLMGTLPWIKDGPVAVKMHKTELAEDPKSFLSPLLDQPYLDCLVAYFKYVYGLDYAQVPDFDRLRNLLEKVSAKQKSGKKRPSEELEEEEAEPRMKLRKSDSPMRAKPKMRAKKTSPQTKLRETAHSTPKPSPKAQLKAMKIGSPREKLREKSDSSPEEDSSSEKRPKLSSAQPKLRKSPRTQRKKIEYPREKLSEESDSSPERPKPSKKVSPRPKLSKVVEKVSKTKDSPSTSKKIIPGLANRPSKTKTTGQSSKALPNGIPKRVSGSRLRNTETQCGESWLLNHREK